MINKIILLFIMGATTFTSGLGKNQQPFHLIKSMATFDQYYIPALLLTNKDQRKESQKALERLTKYWESFTVKFYNYHTDDTQWQSDLNQITISIATANVGLKKGKDLHSIHNDLETIRNTFMQLRKRNHIDYFPDYLTAFHDPLEHLISLVKDKNSTTLSETNIRDISNLFPKIETLWQSTLNAQIQAKLFDFNSKQINEIKQLEKKENGIIGKLKNAIQQDNHNEIITYITQLKPPFVKLYLMFGDFKGLK